MVAILDSWANVSTLNTAPGSFTVSAGTDRILVYKAHNRRGTAVEITAVFYGGQAMTKIANHITALGGADQDHSIWRLGEAGIAAAADTEFDITFASAADGSQYRAQAASYQNVAQSSPIVDSQVDAGGEDSAPTPTAIDTGASGFVVASWANSEGTDDTPDPDITWSNLTEQLEVTATGTYNSIAHVASDGSPFTVSASFTNPRNNSLITFSLRHNVTTLAVGLASETDSGLAMRPQKIVPVGLAVETDTSQTLEQTGTVAVGLAEETDTAFPVFVPKTIVVGLAEETDTALFLPSANDVSILDAWTKIAESAATAGAGVTYSMSAGTNRLLVVAIGEESSTGKPTGVTFGGVAMVPSPRATAGTGFPVTAQFFVLYESGIAAAVNSNIAVQGVGAHDGQFRLFAATYQNAGQVGLVDSDTSANSALEAPPVTISTSGRGTSLGMIANDVGGIDVSWDAAEVIEEDASSSYFSIAEQLTDGTDITFTPSADPINNNCLVAISIKGAAQNVPVGLAAEADTALAIAQQRAIEAGMAAETDSAFPVTRQTGQTVAVGLASETDSAQTVAAVEPGKLAVGLASESDTALSVTPAVGLSVGLAAETDSAQSVTFRREVIVGIAAELDQGFRITSPSGDEQAALARRNDGGTSSPDIVAEAAMEARRRGALRRAIEREEDELLAILPALVKVLLSMAR